MVVVPDTSAWVALTDRLVALTHAEAPHALVLDAWGELVCTAHCLQSDEEDAIRSAARTLLGSSPRPIERGGKIEGVYQFIDGHCYAHSYGGTYLLVVLFVREPDDPVAELREGAIRRDVRTALPAIEALTRALAPPDDPDGGSEAAFGTP